MPESLIIASHYCCHAELHLGLSANFSEWEFATWADIFESSISEGEHEINILDRIVEVFQQGEAEEIAARELREPKNPFPQDWANGLRIEDLTGERQPLQIDVHGKWKFFAGKEDSTILDGSYSVTTGEFIGSQYGPAIDMRSSNPGPSWELVEERPFYMGQSCSVAVRIHGTENKARLAAAISNAFGSIGLR